MFFLVYFSGTFRALWLHYFSFWIFPWMIRMSSEMIFFSLTFVFARYLQLSGWFHLIKCINIYIFILSFTYVFFFTNTFLPNSSSRRTIKFDWTKSRTNIYKSLNNSKWNLLSVLKEISVGPCLRFSLAVNVQLFIVPSSLQVNGDVC